MTHEGPPINSDPNKKIIPFRRPNEQQDEENNLRSADRHPFIGLYEALNLACESRDDQMFINQALDHFKRADELIITGITELVKQNLRMKPEDSDLAFRNALRNFANRVSSTQTNDEYSLLRSNTDNNHLTITPEIYVSFLPPIRESGSVKKAHDAFLGRFLTHTDSILNPKGIHTLQPAQLITKKQREPVILRTYMNGVSLRYSRDNHSHIQAVLKPEAVKKLIESNPQDE